MAGSPRTHDRTRGLAEYTAVLTSAQRASDVTSGERKPWHSIFRLLERDERVFAVLLAVALVGGLATLGLDPLRPRAVWPRLVARFARTSVHRKNARRRRPTAASRSGEGPGAANRSTEIVNTVSEKGDQTQ